MPKNTDTFSCFFPSLNQRFGVWAESRHCHLFAGQTRQDALHPEGFGGRGGGPARCALAERRRATSVRRHQPVPRSHWQQQLDDHKHAEVGSSYGCFSRVGAWDLKINAHPSRGSHTCPKPVRHLLWLYFLPCSSTLSFHLALPVLLQHYITVLTSFPTVQSSSKWSLK